MQKIKLIARAMVALFAAASMILLGSVSASAHAELEASNPIADSVIGAMPAQIELSFGETLMVVEGSAEANQVTVSDAKGVRVDDKKTVVTDRMASVGVAPDAAEGVYTVAYRVVSEDGHPIEGSFKFEVSVAAQSGEAPVATPVPIGEEPEGAPTAVIAPAPEPVLYDGAASGESSPSPLPWILSGATVVAAAAGAFIVFRRRTRD
jgi:methionine-rich copper-binding protein CopC